MDARRGHAHCCQNPVIGMAVKVRVNAALQAHFGRAAFHRFGSAASDFGFVDQIGGTAHILVATLGKGAEAAFIEADIGVVDVAIDDVGDGVSRSF